MYKSIKQIKKLREDKLTILSNVYRSSNLDDVYKGQKALGSMSISIFTDVANAIMPVLREDGVSNVVWSNISLRLNKLSFISVPTAAEIQEKYKKGVDHPTVININGTTPKPGTKTEVRAISLPAFLGVLAAQGIAIPLFFHAIGGARLALVKILYVVNAACMVIEVVKYFNLFPKKSKKETFAPHEAEPVQTANYKDMYNQAIQEVYLDNQKRFDDWFDQLEKITTEEIDKALEQAEG